MPIAKTAHSVEANPVITKTPSPPISNTEYDGIPLDLMVYMGKDFNVSETEKSRLKDIHEWSLDGLEDKTVGNALRKIRVLEDNFTPIGIGEDRLNRFWNYIKIEKSINELRKRQMSFERR